eukprot:TRINITY_DN2434_c0_g2_i2.p1 TRINITY_DN2434_c0_g2~~TRINITY_DN2434_c0_g2_i2.p1  ORF type:complete len:527 (+),score=74.17 TRINITY_DN2434_c0_g2_i2:126-1706(+)
MAYADGNIAQAQADGMRAINSASERDMFRCEVYPRACLTIVVLGASGDLAKKKTFPAIFALFERGFLPENTKIMGYARSALTDDELRDRLRQTVKTDQQEILQQFLDIITYVQGTYDTPEGFQKLQKVLLEREAPVKDQYVPVNRMYYLALPPSVYPQVCKGLKEDCDEYTNENNFNSWLRLVVEKPFGMDLESSNKLVAQLGALYPEEQVYRIDHYLGKEMAQNLLVMRFANMLIYPIWNSHYIDNVQITFKEPFGTEGRGGYFDQFGIIRDVMQNHLLQILALVAMEKPISMHPDDIRDEKVKLLRSILPVEKRETVTGQYAAAHGEPGYLDDEGVPQNSKTPTFATCVLHIKNDRWDGCPFILKAGKALNERKAEVRIQLKTVTAPMINSPEQYRNEFVMRLQPNEAIYVKMVVKKPGLEMEHEMSELELTYKERYKEIHIPDAYERLILDAIRGDQQHFVRSDELRAAWAIFTPLLHAIDAGELDPIPYPRGTRGPVESDNLVQKAGYKITTGYHYQTHHPH